MDAELIDKQTNQWIERERHRFIDRLDYIGLDR